MTYTRDTRARWCDVDFEINFVPLLDTIINMYITTNVNSPFIQIRDDGVLVYHLYGFIYTARLTNDIAGNIITV